MKRNVLLQTAALTAIVTLPNVALAAPFGDNLQDNNQPGTTYLSAQDGDIIRIGQQNTTSGGGAAPADTVINPQVQGGGATIDNVYTSLNSVTPNQTATIEGGLEVDPNTGNTAVRRATTAQASLSPNLLKVRELPVWNQNHGVMAEWGDPAGPSTTKYGYVDGGGSFVEANLSAAAVTALDNFVATPDAANAEALFAALSPADINELTNLGLYTPGIATPTPNTGNFTVEGATMTNGIDNGGQKITGVADGMAATDAATVGQMNTADGLLQDQITSNDTDITNLQGRVTTNEGNITNLQGRMGTAEGNITNLQGRMGTAEGNITNLQGRMGTAEGNITNLQGRVSTNEGNITNLQGRVSTNEGNITNLQGRVSTNEGNIATNTTNITTNTGNIATNTTNIATNAGNISTLQTGLANEIVARTAGDALLQGQINSERTARKVADYALGEDIKTNTRGIAMVAAMTSTTVAPGNTQAVDFNLAHFEGETGFALGYAYAVNENLQLNISTATTTDFDEGVYRAGVSYQW